MGRGATNFVRMLPSQILRLRRAELDEVMSRYPMFGNFRIIGSVARGDDRPDSDIDFLADARSEYDYRSYCDLVNDFEDALGVPVHIIISLPYVSGYKKLALEEDIVPYEEF